MPRIDSCPCGRSASGDGVELEHYFLGNVDGSGRQLLVEPQPLRLLFGRTGAGKTTVLQGLARAARASQGHDRQPGDRGICGVVYEVDTQPLHDVVALERVLAAEREASALWNWGEERPQAIPKGPRDVETDHSDWLRLVWTLARPPFRAEQIDRLGRLGWGTMLHWRGQDLEPFVTEWRAITASWCDVAPAHLEAASALADLMMKRSRIALLEGGAGRWRGRPVVAPQWHAVMQAKHIEPSIADVLTEIAQPGNDRAASAFEDFAGQFQRARSRGGDRYLSFTQAFDVQDDRLFDESGYNTCDYRSFVDGQFLPVAPVQLIDLTGLDGQAARGPASSLRSSFEHLHDRIYPVQVRVKAASKLDDDERGLAAALADPEEGTPDSWLYDTVMGSMVRPTVLVVAELVQERAAQLLPPFLAERNSLVFAANKSIRWWPTDGRLYVGLANDSQGIRTLDELSSGERRWTRTVVELAIAELTTAPVTLGIDRDVAGDAAVAALRGEIAPQVSRNAATSPSSPSMKRRLDAEMRRVAGVLLLIDEPEVHLDQRGELDVADWLAELTRSDANVAVIAATHSLNILVRHPSHVAQLTGVLPFDDGGIEIIDMTTSLQEWLKDFGSEFGVSGASRLLTASGFLVVEGPHDRLVIEHFYGAELAEARVELILLYGTHNNEALTKFEFLETTQRPIALLVDNIRSRNTQEAQAIKDVLRHLEKRSVPTWADGHPFPDIMAVLPEAAVCRAFPDAKFESWARLIDRYRKAPKQNFKDFVMSELDVPVHPGRFIRMVLDNCREDERPHRTLEQRMSEALAHLTADHST